MLVSVHNIKESTSAARAEVHEDKGDYYISYYNASGDVFDVSRHQNKSLNEVTAIASSWARNYKVLT